MKRFAVKKFAIKKMDLSIFRPSQGGLSPVTESPEPDLERSVSPFTSTNGGLDSGYDTEERDEDNVIGSVSPKISPICSDKPSAASSFCSLTDDQNDTDDNDDTDKRDDYNDFDFSPRLDTVPDYTYINGDSHKTFLAYSSQARKILNQFSIDNVFMDRQLDLISDDLDVFNECTRRVSI